MSSKTSFLHPSAVLNLGLQMPGSKSQYMYVLMCTAVWESICLKILFFAFFSIVEIEKKCAASRGDVLASIREYPDFQITEELHNFAYIYLL